MKYAHLLVAILAALILAGCKCGPEPRRVDAMTDSSQAEPAETSVADTIDAPSDADPGSSKRLRVKNACAYDLWIAQQNIPNMAASARLAIGASIDVEIPNVGLASTRVWAMKCDEKGTTCSIGQSSPPCPATEWGCSPPVDSKLEATWGCTLPDKSQCARTPQGDLIGDTYWNGSAVDGFTFPFAITATGGDERSACTAVDCSALSFNGCPLDDNLSNGGKNPAYAHQNLHVFNQKSVQVGCFSPCMKLNYPMPWGDGLGNPASAVEGPYCCPTPPVSAQACRDGSGAKDKYVDYIHKACKMTTYAYPYDDGLGLRNCSPDVKLTLTFGPNCP